MSESGTFDPGIWKRPEHNDFDAARKKYDREAGRGYSENRNDSYSLPSNITSDFQSNLVIACDDTLSMGDYPGIFFGKMPYLDVEGKSYLGQNRGVSFALIGDCFSDDFPLQIKSFVNGPTLKKKLEEFKHERNGGPGFRESYETCALYYARNVNMPNSKDKPIFIFVGDECAYEHLDRDTARKYANVNLERRIDTKDIMDELKKKYSVYFIRKPYTNGLEECESENKAIQKQWESYLGKDHIAILPDAERILDVTFGILANEKDKINYFKEEIEQRQIESVSASGEEEIKKGIKKVKTAYEALAPIFGVKLEVNKKWLNS